MKDSTLVEHMLASMRVLLVSTYEMGHQPLHVALPAARLLSDGHQVRCLDLAVETVDSHLLSWAEAMAVSVPMHTAMRLGVRLAAEVKDRHPQLPVCLYGLYAAMGADRTVGAVADLVIAGEYLEELAAWVDEVACGRLAAGVRIDLSRQETPVPARTLLPGLDRYAHLQMGSEHRLVGYLEASRGCRHRCRHCPLPVIYDGRFRIVDTESLLADVAQLVAMGARHLTFGDPDFLNGPAHAGRVIEAVHDAFPHLTFDITAKVEHLLAHRDLVAQYSVKGLLFVVSAFETTSDLILRLLDKGHTAREMSEVIHDLRQLGVEIRPSWLPFTPWTTLTDLFEIFQFIDEHELWASVDPVQLSIRLLIPEGSLLLALPELSPYLDGYDHQALTHRWTAADPRLDLLQQRLAGMAEAAGVANDDPLQTVEHMWAVAAEMGGWSSPPQIAAGATTGRPRLTEPWFC
jgi:radical SAM superfamily enzyme YgiQ (UPF0313 family)